MMQFLRALKFFNPPIDEPKTRKIINSLSTSSSPIKLEIGSGPKAGSAGWVTLDNYKECDLTWDLCQGLPFEDSSVLIIYASHVLEHFYFEDLVKLLAECRRCLVEGGELSVVVPNARLYIEAYCNNSDFPSDELIWLPGMPRTNSAIDKLNYIAYMGGHHKYMFDEQALLNILVNCHFQDSCIREYDSSLDLPERRFESIYAKALK